MSGRLQVIGLVAVVLVIGMIVAGVLGGSGEESSTFREVQLDPFVESVPVFEFDEVSSTSETTAAERSYNESSKASERNSGKGTVVGTVISALDGKPISEFKLLLVSGDYSFAMEDNFRFHYPTRGTFKIKRPETDQPLALHVRAPGYLESIVAVDSSGDEMVIRLESEFVVSGRVIDQAGIPVEGALIYDTRIPDWMSDRQSGAIARSDAEGQFLLSGLPNKEIVLCGYKNGLSADLKVVTLEHHSTRLELVLRPGGVIAGQATLDGSPVRLQLLFCRVYAQAPRRFAGEIPPDIGIVDIDGRSDEEGRYQIEGMPSGQGYILASIIAGNTMRDMYVDIEVLPGMTTHVDFPFTSTSSSVEDYVVTDGGFANPTQISMTFDAREFDGTDLSCVVNNVHEGQVVFAILVPEGIAIPERVDRMAFSRLSRSSSGKARIKDGRVDFRRVDDGSYTLLVISHTYGLGQEIDYTSMKRVSRAIEIDGQEEIELEVSF